MCTSRSSRETCSGVNNIVDDGPDTAIRVNAPPRPSTLCPVREFLTILSQWRDYECVVQNWRPELWVMEGENTAFHPCGCG